jgi:spectinomycin phosphotransferase
MRDNPDLNIDAIADSLRANYGLNATAITFLPIGYDLNAWVYEVAATDGNAYFLKVRSGPPNEHSLQVPRALVERGVPNILAPLRTRSGELWCSLDERSVVLYPFIKGENAMDAGMTDDQWRTFGAALQAVHSSGLEARFRDRLPVETFAIPSASVVREVQAEVDGKDFESPAAARFAAFWREKADQIQQILARAEELGRQLQVKAQARSFDYVLCHADIHAANILVGEDGQIHLVDWDWPIVAPRERDLLFVAGSKIAHEVTPQEEAHFFAGYGPVEIDPVALAYYRYERVIEDIGDIGRSVFLDARLGEQAKEEAAALVRGFFAPGGMLDGIEVVG